MYGRQSEKHPALPPIEARGMLRKKRGKIHRDKVQEVETEAFYTLVTAIVRNQVWNVKPAKLMGAPRAVLVDGMARLGISPEGLNCEEMAFILIERTTLSQV